MIKLINFIREQVGQGLFRPDASSKHFLEGDRYMKPFMEDDALLYSVDEIFDVAMQQAHRLADRSVDGSAIATLSSEDIQDLLKQNKQLREQVVYYRNALQKTYLRTLELESNVNQSSLESTNGAGLVGSAKEQDHDSHYFTSYDHSGQLQHHMFKKPDVC